MARKKKREQIGGMGYKDIYDWSGGMNNVINPALLNDNESVRLENVSLDEKGTLFPANGSKPRYAEQFSNKAVNGIGTFYKSDGTTRLLIGADNELYVDTPHIVYSYDTQAEFDTGTVQNMSTDAGELKPKELLLPSFSRDSVAYLPNGQQVETSQPRFIDSNLIPETKRNFKGWTAYDGATVTVTQGHTVEEWDTNAATRIQTSGGTSITKYYLTIAAPSVDGQYYHLYVRIKNIGTKTVRINSHFSGKYVDVLAGEIKDVFIQDILGDGTTYFQLLFQALDATDSLDFYAYMPYVCKKEEYYPPQFGQAVMVEEGTTNELTADQSYLKGDWTEGGAQAAYVDWVFDTTNGGATATVNTDITSEGFIEIVWPTTSFNDKDITFSVTAEILAGSIPAGSVRVQIYTNDGNGYKYTSTNITGNGRFSVTRHVPTSPTNTTRTRINFLNGAPAELSIKFTFAQVEQKPYATSWVLGGSTRSPETLTIPTAGVLNPQEGTVECVWIPQQPISGIISRATSPRILQVGNYYQNNSLVLWAYWSSSEPCLNLYVKGSSSTEWSLARTIKSSGSGWYTVGQPIFLAVKWQNGNTFWVSVNGTTYGPYTITDALTGWAGNTMWLGSEGARSYPNALYDDLRISSRARTDAEIADAYNSGAPLPIDEWTTYKMNYNNNLLPAENNISFPLDITRIEAMAYNDSYWLISGDTGIIKKYDGSVVTDLTTEFGLSGTKVNTIDWNGSYWLVGGDNGQIKRYSGTAVTDITETLGFGTSAIKAISHNTLYWLIGGSDGKIKKYDGSGVTDVTTDIDFGTDSINAIEYNGSYFLVAGTSGKIKKYDGTTVTDLTATFGFGAVGITSIKYGDSYFLVGADDGKIKKYDGTTVTDLTASFNLSSIQSISYNGTYWLVSSANGVIKKYDGGAVTDISNIVCLYGSEAPVIDFSSYFLMNANSRTIEFHNFPDFYTYKWFSPVIDVSNSLDKSSGHIDIKSTIVGGGTVSGFSRSSADGVTWSDWVAALADGTLQHPADNYVQVGVKIKKADNNIQYVDTVTVSFDGQAQATLLYSGFSSGGQFFMETFMDTCIIVNGIDPPMKYNGTTITELGGYPPNASYATVHKNRLWLAKGSTLYFSNILDFETWEATNFIQINPNDGDTITGLKQYGDYLIITKQHSMWLLVGDGKTTFAVRRIHSDRGCYSPRSLIVVEGNICFVSDDGIYFSDLTQSILISERIRNYWNSLNLRRLNICASHYKNHALYIAAPSGSSMVNNTVIVFDMLRKAFRGIRTGWNVSCWADFREAGQITTLFGHSDKGQISKIETGYSDNGSPYVMLWRSKEYDFDLPGIYKRWNRIYIDLKPSQYSAEITLTFFVDGVQVGSTVLNVPPAEAENTVYSILALASRAGVVGGRKLAIQLAQQILDNPVGIHKISIEYVVHGIKPKLYF